MENEALTLTEIIQWFDDDAHRRECVEAIRLHSALVAAIEAELHGAINAKDAEIARLRAMLEERADALLRVAEAAHADSICLDHTASAFETTWEADKEERDELRAMLRRLHDAERYTACVMLEGEVEGDPDVLTKDVDGSFVLIDSELEGELAALLREGEA